MTNEEYHAHHAISKSKLDRFAISPWHYHMEYQKKDHYKSKEPTKDMQIGTAIHMAVLEPDLFNKSYALAPDCRRGTKDWKEAESINAGKILLKSDEFDDIISSKNAILNDSIAKELLKNSICEKSFFWTDNETGLDCKCRPDALNSWICDIKKTKSTDLHSFQNSALMYRYWVQAPFYLDGVSAATGIEREGFVFICVEDKFPYSVECYMYDEEDISYGREEYKRLLSEFNQCLLNNKWEKRHQEIRQIKIPDWKKVR